MAWASLKTASSALCPELLAVFFRIESALCAKQHAKQTGPKSLIFPTEMTDCTAACCAGLHTCAAHRSFLLRISCACADSRYEAYLNDLDACAPVDFASLVLNLIRILCGSSKPTHTPALALCVATHCAFDVACLSSGCVSAGSRSGEQAKGTRHRDAVRWGH